MTNQTTSRKHGDSTVADIHKTRERISDAFGGDIAAISADARRRQEQSNCRTVSYAAVTNTAVGAYDGSVRLPHM